MDTTAAPQTTAPRAGAPQPDSTRRTLAERAQQRADEARRNAEARAGQDGPGRDGGQGTGIDRRQAAGPEQSDEQARRRAERERQRAEQVERLLDGLNPQQRAAVLHAGAPLLIVAGAGSGKTSVLTRRIAYLLAARDVTPGQILAITFTNKAAAEMRERVIDLVGPRAAYMWVSTFHSTCVRMLRAQSGLLEGMNSNFSIYDADDSKRLLGMIIRDLDLDPKKFSPRGVAVAISNFKNELVTPEGAAAAAGEDDLAAKTI